MTTSIITEKFDSRGGVAAWKNSTAKIKLLVQDSADNDLNVAAKVLSAYPSTSAYDSLPFVNIEREPLGNGYWACTVNYGQGTPPEPIYTFETVGGSQKITQSLATISSGTAGGGAAPNHHGAIGVTRDSVEGVEITVPVYNFSETHYLTVGTVTDSYKAGLYALTGQVNNAAWRDFSEGEVLFLGASGQQRGWQDWEISFKFSAQPPLSSASIGPFTGISKKGWEYLWFMYNDDVDTSASPQSMIKKPVAYYVERVYPEGDFTALGFS